MANTPDLTTSEPTFCMPSAMAAPDVCRGALTHWPALMQATQVLSNDPACRQAFPLSYGSAQGHLVGGPAQLLASLQRDPTLLMQATPPQDIYARFIWTVMHVYQAVKTVQLTLGQLPDLVAPTHKRTPLENGALVRAVLNQAGGLVTRAQQLAGLVHDFALHLQAVGGDLDAAQSDYQAASQSLATHTAVEQTPSLRAQMQAHAQAQSFGAQTQQNWSHHQVLAAKVTAFSVVANMTSALQALSTAWTTTAAQYASLAQGTPAHLGDGNYLESALNLTQATQEWRDFANMIENFLQRTCIRAVDARSKS
jgi:hypothetical protein